MQKDSTRILTVQTDWINPTGLNGCLPLNLPGKKKEKLRSDLDIYRKLKDALTSLNYGIKFHYIVRLLTQN